MNKAHNDPSKYIVGARFTNFHKQELTGLCFDDAGFFLLSSGFDDKIGLYDALLGQSLISLDVERYGARHTMFTHSSSAILYASNPFSGPRNRENAVCYHDLHTNCVIRTFRKFSTPIDRLVLNPKSDQFVTSGVYDPVQLWDLRSTSPTHIIPVDTGRALENLDPRHSEAPLIAFHPNGLKISLIGATGAAYHFDLRQLNSGPINAGRLPEFRPPVLRQNKLNIGLQQLKYSINGEYLYVSLDSRCLGAIRASDGKALWTLDYGEDSNLEDVEWDGSFDLTFDGSYVCTGSDNGRIHFWDALKGNRVCSLFFETSPIHFITFNPIKQMFATASDNGAINLWMNPKAESQIRQSNPPKSILKIK